MTIEQQYRQALELTHQMLEATRNLHWETLTELEAQRGAIIDAIAKNRAPIYGPQKIAVAQLITTMEQENSEILERVEHWQQGAKILLRMKDPAN